MYVLPCIVIDKFQGAQRTLRFFFLIYFYPPITSMDLRGIKSKTLFIRVVVKSIYLG